MGDRSIPDELLKAIDEEIKLSSKPWRTSREYIIDSVCDKLAHDKGYRKRSQEKAVKRSTTASQD